MLIPISTPKGEYKILLERGALAKADKHFDLDRRVLVVTDDGVPSEYAETIAARCKSAKIVVLPQGEATKCFDKYKELLSAMSEFSVGRRDCVVAVGGGVMGDLAGFAAATYMRGIDFYNVPTTLLSMVDSSIGGKVAIDMDGIKNIVGAFHHPRAVLIDPEVLSTLDVRQVRAGLAEAIKMAATSDSELFELLWEGIYSDYIDTVIYRALLIKKAVVEADPEEKGLRRVLNFGHTVGHAVESYASGRLYHGECVALGTLCMCSESAAERLKKLYTKIGLPTETEAAAEALIPYLSHDKKAEGDEIVTVFVGEIGSYEFRRESVETISKRICKICKKA